jgi:hypothetical protein
MQPVSERQFKSPIEPFRSLADVQILLDCRINYEADRQVPVERVFTLDRMVHCIKALGRPDRAFRTIHVTGTKGKGSVSWVLVTPVRMTVVLRPLARTREAAPDLARIVVGAKE